MKATDQIDLFIMAGYGTNDHIDRNFYKLWGGNWAVWGGGTYKFNEKTSFNAQLSYDDAKNLGVAVNVAHQLVQGFTVTAEVDYVNEGNFGTADYTGSWTNATRRTISAACSASSATSNTATTPRTRRATPGSVSGQAEIPVAMTGRW